MSTLYHIKRLSVYINLYSMQPLRILEQWNHHHYQAIPESRPLLMQPWQHEFGCPVPRPRSFSLGSRPTGTDLMQVSSKQIFNTSPVILPVDSNQNYCSSSKPKNHSRKCGWLLVFLLLLITSLVILGWWKLRQSPSASIDSDAQTDQVLMSSMTQQQHQNQPPLPPPPPQESVYHPLPPPPAPLIPPGSQQQYYAQQQPPTGWQQLSPQQQQQYYQHVPPAPLDGHRNYQQQQQYQQPYANPQYGYPQQYQQPHYGQQQQVNPHQHHVQQHVSHQPEISHQGEQAPRKSWVMEHVDNPTMPIQNDIRHHQQHHQHPHQHQHQHPHKPEQVQQSQQSQRKHPQQSPPPPPHVHQQKPMEPVLSRQEERAKARNQARTMNPIKNSTKVQNDDDIWEEKLSENQTIFEVPVELKLRLEPAQFSFSESVVGKDGTIFVTSFEDDEDVTVEVIEDA
ncbi:G-box-binding factor [Daphnia magna]|uniref:G-box-binding factor n=1 Tax=Daphnia magna TaxID=35525 RepID=UPI001E1BD974|nr:G-box-binding factor [Daphnia magna]